MLVHRLLWLICLAVISPAFAADLLPCVGVPPWLESRVAYYQSFSTPEPELASADIRPATRMDSAPGGVLGKGGVPGAGKGIVLKGAGLSPHAPLVISFWWKLLEPAHKDTSCQLIQLNAATGGFSSHFTRTGPWCGLQQAAAVTQVHNNPGIQNVNGIYEWAAFEHWGLAEARWRHCAMVLTGGSLITIYNDGVKALEVRTTGRPFGVEDKFSDLAVGCPHCGPAMALDEIMILNRPLADAEVGAYARALQDMNAAGYSVR